ncbi:uncharacterized protein [Coffea arabica]|uniref:Uncharacterized protein isoform X2 n=1 Tax=Coffea arabica TaxID=13443 RepID=A0ABM4X0Z2_COFAR
MRALLGSQALDPSSMFPRIFLASDTGSIFRVCLSPWSSNSKFAVLSYTLLLFFFILFLPQFRPIVAVEFVKNDSWPQLVPELREVIQDSDLVTRNAGSQWKTVHALTVFHSIIRPFQYFLNPKLPKEPVPPQLELIAQEILVPILALFHQLVEKETNVLT